MHESVRTLRPGCERRPRTPAAAPTSTFAAFLERHGVGTTAALGTMDRTPILRLARGLAAWDALDVDDGVADLGIVEEHVRIAVFADVAVEFWRKGRKKARAQALRETEEGDWLKGTVSFVEEEGDRLLALTSDRHPRMRSLRARSPVATGKEADDAFDALLAMAMAEDPGLEGAGVEITCGLDTEEAFAGSAPPRIHVLERRGGQSRHVVPERLAERLVRALDHRGHTVCIVGDKPWRASGLARHATMIVRRTPEPPSSATLRAAAARRRKEDGGEARRRLEAMVEAFEAKAARRRT